MSMDESNIFKLDLIEENEDDDPKTPLSKTKLRARNYSMDINYDKSHRPNKTYNR